MKIFFAVISIISMFWGLFDCTKEQAFKVVNAWGRPAPSVASQIEVYFTIQNHTGSPNTLVSLSTPVADNVQLIQSVQKNGIWESDLVSGYSVPGGDVQLQPGKLAVVLSGLKQPLKEGDTFPLSLNFDKAGKIDVDVTMQMTGSVAYHQGL